jgi:aminomethyltransferase
MLTCPAARFGVALSADRGEFPGRSALAAQAAALASLRAGGPGDPGALPHCIRCLAIADRGIARAGAEVLAGGATAGQVTSGTMVPYWEFRDGRPGAATGLRALALACVDARLRAGAAVGVRVRERVLAAHVVERFLDVRAGRYAVPVLGEPQRVG